MNEVFKRSFLRRSGNQAEIPQSSSLGVDEFNEFCVSESLELFWVVTLHPTALSTIPMRFKDIFDSFSLYLSDWMFVSPSKLTTSVIKAIVTWMICLAGYEDSLRFLFLASNCGHEEGMSNKALYVLVQNLIYYDYSSDPPNNFKVVCTSLCVLL